MALVAEHFWTFARKMTKIKSQKIIKQGLFRWNDRTKCCCKFQLTGCSVWKMDISNGCSTETVHIWPHVGKAKMCLRGGSFFRFSKICLHFSAVCLQFFKKTATSQTHFGLTNIGSNIHRFSATAIWNIHFSNGTPCIIDLSFIWTNFQIPACM